MPQTAATAPGLAWLIAGRRILAEPPRLLSLVLAGQLLRTLLAFLVTDLSPARQVLLSVTRQG